MAITRGNPKNVAIHHSAVAFSTGNLTELKARAASHNNYHKANSERWNNTTPGEFGYKWIRYHYMISHDGSLIQTQHDKYALYANGDGGQSVPNSFNMTAVNVMFEGNFETQQPSEAMMRTAVKLIRDLEAKYKIDPRVRGHRELSSTGTACPGRNLGTSQSGWIKQLIANVNDKNYSTEPPKPPEPPQEPVIPPELKECEKQVERLEIQINALNEGLRASQEGERLALDRVEVLEENIGFLEKELEGLESDYDRVKGERDMFEKQYMECVRVVNEGKEHWVDKLKDRILEVWDEFKDNIIKFFTKR